MSSRPGEPEALLGNTRIGFWLSISRHPAGARRERRHVHRGDGGCAAGRFRSDGDAVRRMSPARRRPAPRVRNGAARRRPGV